MVEKVIKDGMILKDFMDYLWETDRKTFSLIVLGHMELVTDELVGKYLKEQEEDV